MKRIHILAASFVLLLAAACGGGGGGTASGVSFVKGQIARTSETTDPVQINDLNLAFPDDTAQFDSVFQ